MADMRFYKNKGPFSLEELAKQTGATLIGAVCQVKDIATLVTATQEHVSFCHRPDQIQNLQHTKACAVIINSRYQEHVPENCAILLSESPYKTYATISQLFYPEIGVWTDNQSAPIHPTVKMGKNCRIAYGAIIQENAEIGDNCQIGPHAVIGRGVILGSNCKIQAGVHISHALIGNQVDIHPGAAIGQSGFGFVMDTTGPVDVPQLGRVLIGDNVRIGANTTIDRGSLGDTMIGAYTRIDNLVQIAHNVQIGKGCIIVAQVGIAGSTIIGDFSAFGGQAGLTEHLKIGSGVRVAAQSGVLKDLPDGITVGGSPCVSIGEWHRQSIALKKLTQKKGPSVK